MTASPGAGRATERQRFAQADAVFEATAAAVDAPPRDGVWSSTDPVTWTFAVTRVYKGRVAERQQVVSELSGASCGWDLPEGPQRWLIFATRDPSDVRRHPAG